MGCDGAPQSQAKARRRARPPEGRESLDGETVSHEKQADILCSFELESMSTDGELRKSASCPHQQSYKEYLLSKFKQKRREHRDSVRMEGRQQQDGAGTLPQVGVPEKQGGNRKLPRPQGLMYPVSGPAKPHRLPLPQPGRVPLRQGWPGFMGLIVLGWT